MFAYCNNNPILYIDKDGDMAAEATIVATNFWNPAGWIAAGIFVIEVVVCVCLIDDAVRNPAPTSPANTKQEIASQSAVAEQSSARASGKRKPSNLPSRSKLKMDINHIMDRHSPNGRHNGNKTVFWLTKGEIIKAIWEAYDSCSKLKTQGDRVLVSGYSYTYNLVIEIWVNIKTKIIETAHPIIWSEIRYGTDGRVQVGCET